MKTPLLIFLPLAATAAAHPQMDPAPREVVPIVKTLALDIDGDGRSELLAQGFDQILRSYKTDDQGRISDATDLAPPTPAGEFASSPAAMADLDGDGRRDIVGFRSPFSSQGSGCVVWYDLGGALFEAPVDIAPIDLFTHATAIAPADFDGDGDIDLFLYPEGPGTPAQGEGFEIFVIQNLGGGQFSAPSPVQSSSQRFYGARPGDIDADGDLDFVAISSDTDEITILRATGAQLQVETVSASLPYTVWLDVVDVDLNGSLDIVAQTLPNVASFAPTFIDVYRSGAAGTFLAPVRVAGSEGTLIDLYAFADVNGDDVHDLVAAPFTADAAGFFGLDVMVGDGAGQFATPVRSGLSSSLPRLLVVSDANSDGRDDVLSREDVGSTFGSDFQQLIRLSTVDAPASNASLSSPVSVSPGDLLAIQAAGDLNSDGLLDVVGTLRDDSGFGQPRVIWCRGNVDSDQLDFGGEVGIRGLPLLVADFNGAAPAGAGVLVRGSDLGPDLYLVQATENGQFLPPFPIGADVFDSLNPPVAVDWDGDGDLDIAGAAAVGASLQWLEQTAPGVFAPAAPLHVSSASNAYGTDFSFGDFNGDGVRDVAILTYSFFSITFSSRLGLGGGALDAEVMNQSAPSVLLVDDFDGDGFDDAAWQRPGPNRLEWLRGGPSGLDSNPAQVLIANLQGDGRVARVDFDGDFDLDIVVLNGSDGAIFGHANLGGGGYSATGVPVASDNPRPLAPTARQLLVADLGGDGDLDILTKDGLWRRNLRSGVRGDSYCDAATANSSGQPGRIVAVGSTEVARETLTLRASDLPRLSFGYFLTSQTAGAPMSVPGSSGLICLGGAVGRYSAPSQIQFSGLDQLFNLELDLSLMPTPNGLIQALPGSTWNFQAWFRDSSPMGATSNFTDAVAVGFQ